MRLSYLWRSLAVGIVVAMPLLTGAAVGQTKGQKGQNYDKAARATVLHDANVYVAADADAQKISLVTPGHEVVVVERSAPWVKVFANTEVGDEANEDDRNKPDYRDQPTVPPAARPIPQKIVVARNTAAGAATLSRSSTTSQHQATE